MEQNYLPANNAGKLLAQAGVDWQIGDRVVSRYMEIFVIDEVGTNPNGEVFIRFENGETEKLSELLKYGYVKMRYPSMDALRAAALEAISNPPEENPPEENGDETAITLTMTASQAQAARIQATVQRDKAELVVRMIESMLRPVKDMALNTQARLKYLDSVLAVLETFAGIYEQIYLLRDGEPASADTPITIRQLVLYMDEEAGITDWLRGGVRGINWQNVDAFDEWLLADRKHLAQVAPEPKCVVALRPSRQRRGRGDWWTQMQENAANEMLYLLIRNGEKVYRIWAGFPIGKLLYPTVTEWAELMEKISQSEDWVSYREKGMELGWKRNIALIQGLLERTDCLSPVAHPVNLFNPDSYGDLINLVRDGEIDFLPTGRPSFRDWQREINTKIKRGDRIFLAAEAMGSFDHNSLWRFGGNRLYTPPPPRTGVYTVEGFADVQVYAQTHRAIKILYTPHWSWGETGGRRIAFYLLPQDTFFLRYESLDADTLRYYINSRIERPRYLEILPLLCGLLAELEAEQEEERQFAELMASQNNVSVDDIYETIAWWKTKTINKRPIRQDDTKAWRMISAELKRQKRKK